MLKTLLTTAAAVAASALVVGCDRSAQNADGTTQAGDPGVAAAPGTVGGADTGRDTGQGGEAGGAGEVGVPAATGSLGPGSTGADASDSPTSGAPNTTNNAASGAPPQ